MNELLAQMRPSALLGLLSDPASNPRAAALLFAAIVVFAIVLILVVGLMVLASAPKPVSSGPRKSGRKRRKPVRREIWVVLGGWMLILGAAVAGADIVLTDSTTCVRCHKDRLEMSIASAQSHSEIDCASCHAVPGIGGRLVLGIQTATDIYAELTNEKVTLDERRPRSESCRTCHRGIGEGVTRKIVRASHREFVDEPGWRCLDCHGGAGHGPRGEPGDRPRMTLCLRCHDGVTASSACPECHPGGITDVRGVSEHDYPQVELPSPTTCEGCHSMAACDKCHGLRMPHPPGYATGAGHGRAGAFNNRNVCKKCHERAECAQERCHPHAAFPSEGHVGDWLQRHGADRSEATLAWCRSCHADPDFGCDMCH